MTTSNPHVVLTGTTGGLGSSVLRHILAQNTIPPSKLIISLYNPAKAPSSFTDLTSLGADIRRGDYTSPESLDSAFEGAGILFLVSTPSIEHKQRVDAHTNAIDAAKRAGVSHVLYTSGGLGGNLGDSSVAAVMRAHLDTEAYLKASGLTYTIIREGMYSESYQVLLGLFDPSSGQEEVCIPEDGNGGIAWASKDELGEAAASLIARAYNNDLLSSPSIHNTTLLLTGPEAISLTSLAALISTLLQRPNPIRIKYVPVDAYATSSPALVGLGPEFVRLWATTYEAIKRGECAVVSPTLEMILGRKPREIRSVLEEMLKDVGAAQGTIDQLAK